MSFVFYFLNSKSLKKQKTKFLSNNNDIRVCCIHAHIRK